MGRKTDKNQDLEKCITKETEVAVFDSTTGALSVALNCSDLVGCFSSLGQRLFSIIDHREIKSNISFLLPNPTASSIVLVGCFSGQVS